MTNNNYQFNQFLLCFLLFICMCFIKLSSGSGPNLQLKENIDEASLAELFGGIIPVSGGKPNLQPHNRPKRAQLIPGVASPHIEVCGNGPIIRSVPNGVDAIKNSWPWMAILGLKNGTWVCNGILINEYWVLTTANCISRSIPEIVRLGEHDYSTLRDRSGHKDFSVERFVIFDGYNPPTIYDDIALLKLNKPAILTESISPICLPWGILSNNELEGISLTITGWGPLEFAGLEHPILRQGTVQVINTKDCDDAYSTLPSLSRRIPNGITKDTILCAANKNGYCTGRAGSPAAYVKSGHYVLAGILSRGYGCGNPNFPGLYVPVSQKRYMEWIKRIAF